MRRLFYQLLLFVGLTLLFNACGDEATSSSGFTKVSSSGGSSTQNTGGGTQVNNGGDKVAPADNGKATKSATKVIFVDTFCTGISYTGLSVNNTVTGTGTTGADGYATLPEGSAYVQFELGGLVLGKVKASQVITVTDLFRNSNLNDNRVMFAARLLLTLDEDENPDNGIQISQDVGNRIGYFEGSDAIGHYKLTTLNKSEEEVTAILNELVDFLGIPNHVVSEEEAKAHLEKSMSDLEGDVTTRILKVGDVHCPNGGIAKVHKVDFDKTDNNATPKEYIDYLCDETTTADQTKHFVLLKGNEKCPDGGIRIHHKLYTKNLRTNEIDSSSPISEYDEYRCKGLEAYKYNTFVIYSVAPSDDNCNHLIKKATQTKKENNISVVSNDDELICADREDGQYVELATLVEDSICVSGGVRVDVYTDDSKSEFVSSLYYCNQATEKGNVQGEHKIKVVEANATVCPNGGKEIKHSVDYDNNGELDTFYSEIKCDDSSSNDSTSSDSNGEKVEIVENRVLLQKGMSDFSKCPYGGYRIEKTMKQGDKILAEWNDYNCTDTTDLIKDEVTPVTLKASDYSSTANHWCPNGGIKYNHKVYFNGILNHKYYDINCSPVTTSEENTTTKLEIGDTTCPYGGKIVTHKVIFNGDPGHPSNYEYNTTHCNGFDYNQTTEEISVVDKYSQNNVDCKVELHKKLFKGVHIPAFDYNTTTCEGLEWDEAKVTEETEYLPIGSKVCPDGGKKVTYIRTKPDGTVIDDWTYSVVMCKGLEYSDTREVNDTRILPFGDATCPYGGKIVTHKRYTKDTNEHIAKWDYNTTHCSSIEYNETQEEVTVVKRYIIGDGNTVCPTGGVVKNHKRYLVDENGEKIYVPYWEFNTTHCTGLDYNQTEDIPVVVDNHPSVCPYGGKVILHRRYTKDGGVHIPYWDYNSTVCNSLEYSQTEDRPEVETLEIGNPICPDGGKIIHHKRYADTDGDGKKDNHIADWDYSETICNGLDYNQTVEKQIVTVWKYGESDVCPDGGKFIQHQRYLDSDQDGIYTEGVDVVRIKKWDYNSTHCDGLDYNGTIDFPIEHTLEIGDATCPDGGKIIEHQRWTVDEDGNKVEHIAKWDFNSTHCVGIDYNETVECGTKKTVWTYGESDVCPQGGVFFEHKRCLIGTNIHIAKWDYNTTTCKGLDYNETEDRPVVTVWKYGESDICPDGGIFVQHKRYIKGTDTHIKEWDYNTTTCKGLNYNETLEDRVLYQAPANICPYDGNIIQHIRYIDNNNNGQYDREVDTHVAKWDYNTTECKGLEYNETLKYEINTTIPFGSDICPDGGTQVTTIRYIDNNGNGIYDEDSDRKIDYWTFTSVYCKGLDYNGTLEHNESVTLKPDPKVCPYGGKEITHIRYIDVDGDKVFTEGVDTRVDKWTFKTTHCSAGEQNDSTVEVILPVGDENCPNGGKIVEHNVTNNGVDVTDFDDIRCGREGVSYDVGLDGNFSVAGYITDMNGTRIAGATVDITVDGKVYEVVTGVNGVYQFYNVAKGSTISVSADGYIPVKDLTVTSSVLDVVLVPSSLSYVKDMDLIFFPIDREMGADKAIEYADVKGWRLLTFSELQALYYSNRRSEFKAAEYFSSTKEVTNKDGYTLWALNFSNGEKFPFWFSWRKHIVFTNVKDKKPIPAREFKESNDWTNWYIANSICSSKGMRLPTIDEMKKIYFNSTHPIGIADKNVVGGEYWLLRLATNVKENGEEYKTAKFFRVVGPVEDYHIEYKADPNLSKKVLCVQPDANEEATISGTVKAESGETLDGVQVKFKLMDFVDNKQESYQVTTESNGTYSITIPAGRYYVEFDAPQTLSTKYSTKSMTVDLRSDTVLDVSLTTSDNSSNSDVETICDETSPECERILFQINSNLNTDTNTWTYSVEKLADGNVNMSDFTLKLSPLCMEQITNLQGGEPVSLNSLGIVDGIKSTTGQISFVVHSSAEYDPDVDTLLSISTDNGKKLSVNIATPVCFYLDENNSVAGKVVDTKGNPVAGATVTAITTYTGADGEEKNEYQFTTDNSGAFTSNVVINFKNETVNGIFLAKKDGYDSLADATKSVTLRRDEVNQIGTLVLTPQQIDVTGVVKSENGDVLSGATVVIRDEDGNELASLVTDNDGSYSYSTEVGAKISIEISLNEYSSESIALTTITPSLYEFNFTLKHLDIDVNITSSVVDKVTNGGIPKANVVVEDSEGNAIATTTADENGKFTVSISKGVDDKFGVVIKASATGYKENSVKIEELGNKNRALEPIQLETKPATLNITVRDGDWTGLQNGFVYIYTEGATDPIARGYTDEDGKITFDNIPAGSYRLSVSIAGGYQRTDLPLVVKNGQVRDIDITMTKLLDSSSN